MNFAWPNSRIDSNNGICPKEMSFQHTKKPYIKIWPGLKAKLKIIFIVCSNEGNAGERWKTTIGLIRKKNNNNFARAAHFFCINIQTSLCIVVASISHFVYSATRFSCCSSYKNMSPLTFISRSRLLSPLFSLSFAGLPPTFSFSLSFSCSIFQTCEHNN